MPRISLAIAALVAWVGLLFGLVQFAQADFDLPHGICGPWGCGPRSEALLGLHGFWLALLMLPAALAMRYLSRRNLRAASLVALVIGLGGMAGIAVWEAVSYLPTVAPGMPSYFWRRVVFRLAVLVDVPLGQMAVLGSIGIVVAAFKRRGRNHAALYEDTRGGSPFANRAS